MPDLDLQVAVEGPQDRPGHAIEIQESADRRTWVVAGRFAVVPGIHRFPLRTTPGRRFVRICHQAPDSGGPPQRMRWRLRPELPGSADDACDGGA